MLGIISNEKIVEPGEKLPRSTCPQKELPLRQLLMKQIGGLRFGKIQQWRTRYVASTLEACGSQEDSLKLYKPYRP